ncbi:hypothetical protein ABIA54_001489 [Pseudomonas sp. EB276 TE3739]|uniref:hypothetical protein n=1 Tax=Pseudomonas TaxID=286 RepID=UPI0020A18C90|nr:hypothetical protein [Pseudomonas koreensis]MCP1474423.1 hypothetical protein [Pseudomonas koreensis]
MTDKRFAIQMLPAPVVKEADNNVLHVKNFHGVVPAVQEAAPGDTITLILYDSDKTRKWSDSVALTAISVGKPIPFAISKTHFEEMLTAKKNAVLQYSLQTMEGVQKLSIEQLIELKD